jgi:hypothetical protein
VLWRKTPTSVVSLEFVRASSLEAADEQERRKIGCEDLAACVEALGKPWRHMSKHYRDLERRIALLELRHGSRETKKTLFPRWLRDTWSKQTGLPFDTEEQTARSCRLMHLAAGHSGPAAFTRMSKADQGKIEVVRQRMKQAADEEKEKA